MLFLIPYIRRIIYALGAAIAIAVFIIVSQAFPPESLRNIRLAQTYAFLAIGFLYLSMLSSPLYAVFPRVPGKPLFHKARKGFGLGAFLFACLHVYFAFFKLLGGFQGLPFLNAHYLVPIIFSTVAFAILTMMAITSLQTLHRALGKWWKRLHRFVYVVAILIPIHALSIGTHFSQGSSWLADLFVFAWLLLLLLEEIRLYRYLTTKLSILSQRIYAIVLVALFAAVFYFFVLSNSLSIHNHGT